VQVNGLNNSKREIVIKVCLFIYILVLLKLIVFKYPSYLMMDFLRQWHIPDWQVNVNLLPLTTIKNYLRAWSLGSLNTNIMVCNLLGNILIFIPFGFLLPVTEVKYSSFKRLMVSTVFFVLTIETFQLITNLGRFDVDDIILNVLGMTLGYLLWRILCSKLGYKVNHTKSPTKK